MFVSTNIHGNLHRLLVLSLSEMMTQALGIKGHSDIKGRTFYIPENSMSLRSLYGDPHYGCRGTREAMQRSTASVLVPKTLCSP